MLSTRGPGLRVPRAPFLPAGAALADPDDGTMAGGVRVLAGVSTLLPSNHLRKAPQVTFPKLRSDSATPASVNSQGQNPGVGSLSLLQWIFPTQGSNSGLPHCRQILYKLSHQGSPRMLEWVAIPFSSRSSRPRDQTQVSRIMGGFFTN